MKTPHRLMLFALGLAATTPAVGQSRATPDDVELAEQRQQQQAQQQEQAAPLPGRAAESAAGRVGQRQTREDTAPNLRPMGRVSNRIENRVQSRIRNRIDRDYDPQANAKSPFATAEDNERNTGR